MPKDNLKWEAVISEILQIENAKVGARRQLYCNAKNTSLTQEMIQIASLRHKNKFSQLEKIVDRIKKKYKSLRNAHKLLKHDLNWKRFHTICNPKKKLHVLQRISKEELNEVIELYNHPSVTMTIPFKRYAKKQFMIASISEAY